MMLDVSKAFDHVDYVSLFKIILQKQLCFLTCCLLAYMYTMQSVRIKWGHYVSKTVTVTNGVKQGGVLSPIFFTLYMDEMFYKFKISGLVLLNATLFAMKKMLKICDEFGTEYIVTIMVASTSSYIFLQKVSSS